MARDRPEFGPRVLFLSGGTALRRLSRRLKLLTHNSIHLITPFDSGGSSAKLREAFRMPSVGDLRNRLMALADETARGNPEIYRLFALRLPTEARSEELHDSLDQLVSGNHPFIEAVPDPMQGLIRSQLRFFAEHMPSDFDLRGASIGNLMLAGSYLNNDRAIDPVISMYSQLAEVRGQVRAICDADLQLAAELSDGSKIIGQHLLTGKAHPPIQYPIAKLFLAESAKKPDPVSIKASSHCLEMIADADLICFPMGSFYSSVVANLLPEGVGRAIAETDCPKVFVPNTGKDPEMLGLSPLTAVETLIRYVRADAGPDTPMDRILSTVILAENGEYPVAPDRAGIEQLGLQVTELDLESTREGGELDAEKLGQALVSLAWPGS
jgi:CofD-related protein of GAK system